jgi:hypothetical protein
MSLAFVSSNDRESQLEEVKVGIKDLAKHENFELS